MSTDPPTPQQAILDALTEGVFTVDREFRITALNRAAEEICGIGRAEALGMPCRELFRASCCDGACALAETIAREQPIHCRRARILDADGVAIPVSISTNILRDQQGRIIGGVETFRDLSQIAALQRALNERYRFDDLVFRSQAMRAVVDQLPIIADSTATVLIRGASGTGKELVARALHHSSPRRAGPFVAVNCGALPDSLLESELFGYRKGAFTDATRDKPGRFALAAGGSLFLDEIGDISAAMQVRLLRVLQEKCYEPLGAIASEPADVRIIAATNRDLEAAIAAGDFRQDLYYRLDVVGLRLPTLRERPEDIPLLVDHFLTQHRLHHDQAPEGFTTEALQRLLAHDFPGNVRELENIVERACVLCRTGQITLAHLPPSLQTHQTQLGPRVERAALATAEAAALRRVLEDHDWNRSATAAALGIHPTTLYRKLKRLGIQPPGP